MLSAGESGHPKRWTILHGQMEKVFPVSAWIFLFAVVRSLRSATPLAVTRRHPSVIENMNFSLASLFIIDDTHQSSSPVLTVISLFMDNSLISVPSLDPLAQTG
jgi:hypothetical protein